MKDCHPERSEESQFYSALSATLGSTVAAPSAGTMLATIAVDPSAGDSTAGSHVIAVRNVIGSVELSDENRSRFVRLARWPMAHVQLQLERDRARPTDRPAPPRDELVDERAASPVVAQDATDNEVRDVQIAIGTEQEPYRPGQSAAA